MRCKHCNEPIYKTKYRVWLHKENSWYICENTTTISKAEPKPTVKQYYEMCKM
jgi:hypothetical protein